MRQLFKRLGNVSRMIRIVPLTALAAAAVVALFSASGERGLDAASPFKARSGTVLSWMEHQGKSEEHEGKGESNGPPTIVGLWHLKYTADDGSAFLESFKTWHADGTEFENAFFATGGGNICFGVWKETGRLSVKLPPYRADVNPDGSIKPPLPSMKRIPSRRTTRRIKGLSISRSLTRVGML